MQKKEKRAGMTAAEIVKICALAAGELFALVSILYFTINGPLDRLLLSMATVFLVLCPMLFERLFKCVMAPALFSAAVVYSVCPLIGHCYDLYYIVPWWDKMLHFTGGVVFAVIGYFICSTMCGKDASNKTVNILFAICFSVSVSAFWEFFEFGADVFAGTDMQNDRYINGINSYFLGDSYEAIGSIREIESVTVNGIEIGGYIDIGLIDTMGDMMIETLGAVFAAVVFTLHHGGHQWIYPAGNEKTEDQRKKEDVEDGGENENRTD